ncbi:MAG: hypothetical protein WC861_03460 [Candidatus Micrarchaeia archaeon]|jgi:hypothetical protein
MVPWFKKFGSKWWNRKISGEPLAIWIAILSFLVALGSLYIQYDKIGGGIQSANMTLTAGISDINANLKSISFTLHNTTIIQKNGTGTSFYDTNSTCAWWCFNDTINRYCIRQGPCCGNSSPCNDTVPA